MSDATPVPMCRDLPPLSDLDLRCLALWLDARAKEEAAWGLLMADLTPNPMDPTDFPKDA